jgi:hypothetical protein
MRIVGANPNIITSVTARKRIVKADMYTPGEGANICQPALIAVPSWVVAPLGTYYLYWSSHLQGDASYGVPFQHMKLLSTTALSIEASLAAPWTVHAPGTIILAQIEAFGPYGHNAALAHLGFNSFEDTGSVLRLWTHANCLTLGHSTVYAESADGIAWTVLNGNVGATDGIYLAIFQHSGTYYAIEESGILRRSSDINGITNYVRQSAVETFRAAMIAGMPGNTVRHCGVSVTSNTLTCYYTIRGDAPERVWRVTADLSVPDWENWTAIDRTEIFSPAYDFEGRWYNLLPSAGGPATSPVRQIRDPYPFIDPADGSAWLVYAAAGENSIGVTRL